MKKSVLFCFAFVVSLAVFSNLNEGNPSAESYSKVQVERVEIYPNPAASYISLSVLDDSVIRLVKIISQTGEVLQKVSSSESTLTMLDISVLEKGQYQLEITFEDGKVENQLFTKI
jgi:hypothetical protein